MISRKNWGRMLNFAPGDEVTICMSSVFVNDERSSAFIKDIEKTRSGYIAVASDKDFLGLIKKSGRVYDVFFNPNGTCYDRMKDALEKLEQEQKSNYSVGNTSMSIAKLLLGLFEGTKMNEIESDIKPINESYSVENTPGLGQLNDSQKVAIQEALKRTISLIQGPPGTGKTMTTAALVYHLLNMNPAKKNKIIVTAPGNFAVDVLCERIQQTGVKVLRVYSRAREDKPVNSSIRSNTLHIKAELELKDTRSGNDLDPSQLKTRIERKFIIEADVICCTCSTSADMRFDDIYFPVAIIDESSQANIPLALTPIMKGSKKVIIVGDHKQLGPVVISPDACALGFELSLFERLINQGLGLKTLQTQYRMHPAISAFPNKQFYEGKISDGVTELNRKSTISNSNFAWPNNEHPIVFINIKGSEKSGPSGFSYQNEVEAIKAVRVAVQLAEKAVIQPGSDKPTVGILTFYDAHRKCLLNQLKDIRSDSSKNIEIDNVDAFQGREKDFIVLSCVRSNYCGKIGFVDDERRLNVALTRAKYGLVIVGDADCLSQKSALWSDLIQSFKCFMA